MSKEGINKGEMRTTSEMCWALDGRVRNDDPINSLNRINCTSYVIHSEGIEVRRNLEDEFRTSL
jgi:hypothetical protein